MQNDKGEERREEDRERKEEGREERKGENRRKEGREKEGRNRLTDIKNKLVVTNGEKAARRDKIGVHS